jgi:seryl-tRNA synthetase
MQYEADNIQKEVNKV